MSDSSDEEINIKNIINEKKLYSKTNINLHKMYEFSSTAQKTIYKINIHKGYGTGFLCKIQDNQNIVLITNNQVLNKEYFKEKDEIELEIDKDKIILKIEDRKIWTDEKIDFCIIEIKKHDGINNYLVIDENIDSEDYSNLDYKGKSIIVPSIMENQQVEFGYGEVLSCKNKSCFFHHNCNTENGSSGGPIISVKNMKVIGIHKGYDIKNRKNVGIFIKNILDSIKNENIFKKEDVYKKQNINYAIYSENVFGQVKNIIHDAIFNILQEKEEFCYLSYDEKENKQIYKNITLEELICLKNKIHLETINNIEIENDFYEILVFYRNMVSNLEVINEYINALRIKGCILPIKIIIKISRKNNETPYIKYYFSHYFGDKETNFEEIEDFLFKAKIKYISQIDLFYKKKSNLRLIYGKQFINIMKHLESNYNINSILRYILNITDNNKHINDGDIYLIKNTDNYIKEYELYIQNSLNSISKYIASLFKNNNKKLEDLLDYNKIKIISENKEKGIFLQECEDNTMEEFILKLFFDKLK